MFIKKQKKKNTSSASGTYLDLLLEGRFFYGICFEQIFKRALFALKQSFPWIRMHNQGRFFTGLLVSYPNETRKIFPNWS